MRFVIFIVFFFCVLASRATHIAGGDITYKNLGNNLFEINMQIFLDCENGTSGAIELEQEIFISMFDAKSNTFIRDFKMTPYSTKDRITGTPYKCVKIPANACIQIFRYRSVQNINPGTNGVIISWQRCCRNNIIKNINAPGEQGLNAWTTIPPASIKDNSPVFKNNPVLFTCRNAPLTLDLSATDDDGDSLVYEFYKPFIAATSDAPRPGTNFEYSRPPFQQVQWVGNYGTNQSIIGQPQLKLDPKTGELTVTPTTTGTHLLGYTVKEYRNGVYIGETRRDYQINIIECQFDVLANFKIDGGDFISGDIAVECRDTVKFLNTSQKATSYLWDFGDPTTDTDVSTEKDPIYVYPGLGDYKVKLKVKNSICEDEYTLTVKIRSKKPFTLGPDRTLCEVKNVVLDTKINDASSIKWSTNETGRAIVVNAPGMYIADVSYGRFCKYSDAVSLFENHYPRDYTYPKTP